MNLVKNKHFYCTTCKLALQFKINLFPDFVFYPFCRYKAHNNNPWCYVAFLNDMNDVLELNRHILPNRHYEINCNKHHNKPFSHYCKKCKVHLCQQCYSNEKNIHKEHLIIQLDEEPINYTINEAKKCLMKAKYQINFVMSQLKAKASNNKLVQYYDECIKRNSEILIFFSALIDEYQIENPNYIKYQNILNLCTFKIQDIPSNETDDALSTFLDTYFIITRPGFKLKKTLTPIPLDSGIITRLLLLKDGRLLICENISLCVYEINSNSCNFCIQGVIDSTLICQLNNGNVICGINNSLSVFSFQKYTYQCLISYMNNSIGLDIVPISDNMFATNYYDKINIWSLGNIIQLTCSFECLINNCILIWNEVLIGNCRKEKKIMIWNIKTYKYERCIHVPFKNNKVFKINDNKIIFISEDNDKMTIMNTENWTIEFSYSHYEYFYKARVSICNYDENRIILHTYPALLLFNTQTNKIEHFLKLSAVYIPSVVMVSKHNLAFSLDDTIQIATI